MKINMIIMILIILLGLAVGIYFGDIKHYFDLGEKAFNFLLFFEIFLVVLFIVFWLRQKKAEKEQEYSLVLQFCKGRDSEDYSMLGYYSDAEDFLTKVGKANDARRVLLCTLLHTLTRDWDSGVKTKEEALRCFSQRVGECLMINVELTQSEKRPLEIFIRYLYFSTKKELKEV